MTSPLRLPLLKVADIRPDLRPLQRRGFLRNVSLGGLALLCGYIWAAMRRMKRAVTPELMRFHRREQMKKLRAILRTLLRFKKVDSFRLAPTESHTQP